MDTKSMIHKANAIAQYFEPYEEERAVESIKNHFEKFWEPRMIKQLTDYVNKGGEDLEKLVIAAVNKLSA